MAPSNQPSIAGTPDLDHTHNRLTADHGSQNISLRPKTTASPTNGVQNAAETQDQPLQATETAPDDGDDEAGEDRDHGVATNEPPTEEKKKKKKSKSRKPASKRGLAAPTGFEDYFADAPLTPDEHAEEQELYHPGLPFVDRILTAISRFERTRKLTSDRRDVFYKYLAYGGLTVSPNIGQGGVDTEGMTKTQIAHALSNVFASSDKRDLGTSTSIYQVDFLGCMRGFISRRTKGTWGLETKDQAELICSTLERFMDYLLQHDVCAEHKDDILATRKFCRNAASELWDMAEAIRRLPGEFNIACSTLFDGSYAHNYDGETWWGKDDEAGPVFVGMKPEEAQQVVKFGVAGAASEHVYLSFLDGVQNGRPLMLDVVNIQEQTSFEVTGIEKPTSQCKEIYVSQTSHFRPVGRVTAKPWLNPDAPPEDLTDAERNATPDPSTDPSSPTEYVFFIEEIVQDMLRVGNRIQATVRTLGCGIMFFDDVLNVYPSFDEFIPNEWMVGWKSPRPLKGAVDYVSGEDDDDEVGNGDGGEDEPSREEVKIKADGAGGADADDVKDTAEKALADVMKDMNEGAVYKDGDDVY